MWFFLSLFFAFWTSVGMPITKRITKSVHPLVLIFVLNIGILPVMFGAILFLGGIPKTSVLFYELLVVSAVIDAIGFATNTWGIKLAPVSLVAPINSFTPVVTTLLAATFIHETPTPLKLVGICTIVLGTYLLHVSDIKDGILAPITNLFSNKGVILTFISSIAWGITPILQKQAIAQTSPASPLFTVFFGFLLVTVFVFPFALPKLSHAEKGLKKNAGLLLVTIPFIIVAQLAAFTAFNLAPVGYVTSVFKLSTLFTIIWGAVFLKEDRIGERLLGAGVMVLGTVLLAL